jgi:hypothetical protein
MYSALKNGTTEKACCHFRFSNNTHSLSEVLSLTVLTVWALFYWQNHFKEMKKRIFVFMISMGHIIRKGKIF